MAPIKCKKRAERNGVIFCGNDKYSCALKQELKTCPLYKGDNNGINGRTEKA